MEKVLYCHDLKLTVIRHTKLHAEQRLDGKPFVLFWLEIYGHTACKVARWTKVRWKTFCSFAMTWNWRSHCINSCMLNKCYMKSVLCCCHDLKLTVTWHTKLHPEQRLDGKHFVLLGLETNGHTAYRVTRWTKVGWKTFCIVMTWN